MKDRLILVNQYKILQKIEPQSEKKYDNLIEILEQGYEGEYGELSKNFSTFSLEECKFVDDVLGMYSDFYYLNKETPFFNLKLEDIKFLGFSKSDESQYLCYTTYLLDNVGSFEEIKEMTKGNYRSIFPTPQIEMYKKMLIKYKQYEVSELTEEIITEILNIE